MSADEKKLEDQASGEKTFPQEATDMEEVIDLVEEIVSTDADDAQAMDSIDLEPSSAENEEDVIELTDMLEEPAGQQDSEEDQIIELVDEVEDTAEPEEQDIIELTDVVEDTGDSGEEHIIELTDVVEEQDLEAEEEESVEWSEGGSDAMESAEDSLLEDVGLEMPEEGGELGLGQEAGEESSDISEEIKEEPLARPSDEALESALREKLPDDRLEAIIRRVVAESIEKKADRILLEVAEAAIAKEIERLKQAR